MTTIIAGGRMGSTNTSTVPPHTPGSPRDGSSIVYDSVTALPFFNDSRAALRTRFSSSPPPTVPTNFPSEYTSILLPTWRGVDPSLFTTVHSAADSLFFSSSESAWKMDIIGNAQVRGDLLSDLPRLDTYADGFQKRVDILHAFFVRVFVQMTPASG